MQRYLHEHCRAFPRPCCCTATNGVASFAWANATAINAKAAFDYANGVYTNTAAAFSRPMLRHCYNAKAAFDYANGVYTNTAAAFAKANTAATTLLLRSLGPTPRLSMLKLHLIILMVYIPTPRFFRLRLMVTLHDYR